MKQINSLANFEGMLHAERVVVFIFSARSGHAQEARRVFEQWHQEFTSQPGNINFHAYLLSPDEHPFTWKWVNEAMDTFKAGERQDGFIFWLKKGSLVSGLPGNAPAMSLSQMTNRAFASGEVSDASASVAWQNEMAPFDIELLKIICCPETHQELKLAPPAVVEKLNQQIAAGRAQNRVGRVLRDLIDGGLVRADGRSLYPLRENIPVLLVDEAIPLTG